MVSTTNKGILYQMKVTIIQLDSAWGQPTENIRRAESEISEIIDAQQNATRTDIGNSFMIE